MRPYRAATASERGARAEQRRVGGLVNGAPFVVLLDQRQPFDWRSTCSGLTWSLHFEPNPRDVRQWRVFHDGACGCAPAWRARGGRVHLRWHGAIGAAQKPSHDLEAGLLPLFCHPTPQAAAASTIHTAMAL